MDYEKNYADYATYVKTLNRKKGQGVYYEKHHIIPRCIGGADTKDNLVLLTAREHFLAHYLLAKIYFDTEYSYQLSYAFIAMKRDPKNCRYVNSRLYESLKQQYAIDLSKKHKGKIPWNKGVPRSEEVKNAISKANKGKSSWNKGKTVGPNSKESNKRRSEALKGREPWNKGGTSWNKGKKVGPNSKESNRRRSESAKAYWRNKKNVQE